MSKKGKSKTSSVEKVAILIENFNTKTNKHEIGKQEIQQANLSEIKEILLKDKFTQKYTSLSDNLDIDDIMPETENPAYKWFLDTFYEDKIEDLGFHARIITENFIITKFSKNLFEYMDKTQKMFILRPLYSREEFSLDEKNDFPKKIFKPPIYKKLLKVIVPFILPSLFLYFLFWALLFYTEHYGFDLIFTIFWSWLVILAFFNIFYSLRFHFKKEKIQFHIPFLNQVKPYDLSRFNILIVLILGVIYLSLYFLFMEVVPKVIRFILRTLQLWGEGISIGFDWLSTEEGLATIGTILPAILFVCAMGGCTEKLGPLGRAIKWILKILGWGIYYISKGIYYTVTVPFQLAYLQFKLKREKKIHLIHLLNKHIQEGDHNWDVRDYYLQLIFEVEKVPLVKVDALTKLLAFLTFLLSTIPPFLTLYL